MYINRLNGLGDASAYDQYGDFNPDNATYTPAPDQTFNFVPVASTANSVPDASGAPNPVSSDWTSILKNAISSYGAVKQIDAATQLRTIQANQPVQYPATTMRYPTAMPGVYSPYPPVVQTGSAPFGVSTSTLIGVGLVGLAAVFALGK